jgi:hypothetical protein
MDMHLGRGAVETGGGFLPVGDLGISGDEKVLFLHVVLRAAAVYERQQQNGRQKRYEAGHELLLNKEL